MRKMRLVITLGVALFTISTIYSENQGKINFRLDYLAPETQVQRIWAVNADGLKSGTSLQHFREYFKEASDRVWHVLKIGEVSQVTGYRNEYVESSNEYSVYRHFVTFNNQPELIFYTKYLYMQKEAMISEMAALNDLAPFSIRIHPDTLLVRKAPGVPLDEVDIRKGDKSIVRAVARSLGRLHGLGIVHQDLVTARLRTDHIIWDSKSGKIRFIDFGQAIYMDLTKESGPLPQNLYEMLKESVKIAILLSKYFPEVQREDMIQTFGQEYVTSFSLVTKGFDPVSFLIDSGWCDRNHLFKEVSVVQDWIENQNKGPHLPWGSNEGEIGNRRGERSGLFETAA